MSNDLTEHSRFRSQALMWAFMIVAACLSHILFSLKIKRRVPAVPAGCKRHSLQNRRYRFFVCLFVFFCVLQASTKTSPKHEASAKRELLPGVGGGGEHFLVTGLWGCAARWGRIFTTGLTIMGLHFQQSY